MAPRPVICSTTSFHGLRSILCLPSFSIPLVLLLLMSEHCVHVIIDDVRINSWTRQIDDTSTTNAQHLHARTRCNLPSCLALTLYRSYFSMLVLTLAIHQIQYSSYTASTQYLFHERAAPNPRQSSFRCSVYPSFSTSIFPAPLTNLLTLTNRPAPRPSCFLTTNLPPHQARKPKFKPTHQLNSTPSTPKAQKKPSRTHHLSPSASPPDSSQQTTTTTCSPKTHPRKTQLADHLRSAACPRLRADSQEPAYNRAEGRRARIPSVE